jgi:hypothetical protein
LHREVFNTLGHELHTSAIRSRCSRSPGCTIGRRSIGRCRRTRSRPHPRSPRVELASVDAYDSAVLGDGGPRVVAARGLIGTDFAERALTTEATLFAREDARAVGKCQLRDLGLIASRCCRVDEGIAAFALTVADLAAEDWRAAPRNHMRAWGDLVGRLFLILRSSPAFVKWRTTKCGGVGRGARTDRYSSEA